MRYLFIFTAGILFGKKWNKVKNVLAPYVGNAAEQFDAMYSQVAQKVGQQYEGFEDKLAEQRYQANTNHSHS